MLKKTIKVGDKEVAFRSSATVPRLYRAKFKRDIFKDLAKLENSYKGSKEEGEEFAIDDLEIFENVAYIMAYHADNTIPSNIDNWLDQFDMFSIYEVLPEILALWGTNLITDIDSKKNLKKQQGNDNTLVPLALPRDRSFQQRLGLFDHWNGDGHLDRKSK